MAALAVHKWKLNASWGALLLMHQRSLWPGELEMGEGDSQRPQQAANTCVVVDLVLAWQLFEIFEAFARLITSCRVL
jgi:hypothetical protein